MAIDGVSGVRNDGSLRSVACRRKEEVECCCSSIARVYTICETEREIILTNNDVDWTFVLRCWSVDFLESEEVPQSVSALILVLDLEYCNQAECQYREPRFRSISDAYLLR